MADSISVVTWIAGVVTLALGAVFNSALARSRDDYLRRKETGSLAAALKAEIQPMKAPAQYPAVRAHASHRAAKANGGRALRELSDLIEANSY